MDESIGREMLVALELIRRELVTLPTSFARNLAEHAKSASAAAKTPPPAAPKAPPMKPPAAAGGGGLAALGAGITGAFTKAIGAILPSMNLFAQMLQSASSGTQLFVKSFQLLAAVLAPILLPVLFLFAAGLLYLSDMAMKYLWPAFKALWDVIGPGLTNAFKGLADVVKFLMKGLQNFLDWVKNKTGMGPGNKDGIEKNPLTPDDVETYARDNAERKKQQVYKDTENLPIANKAEREAERWRLAEKAYDEEYERQYKNRGMTPPGPGGGGRTENMPKPGEPAKPNQPKPPEPPTKDPSFLKAMRDMLKTFEMSVGRQAQFGDLGAGTVQAAMLAALNQDPIEQRMLETMKFSKDLLQRLVDQAEKDDKGTHTAKP